jgi:hypothetical protein
MKIDLKKLKAIFFCQHLPAKTNSFSFRFISLISCKPMTLIHAIDSENTILLIVPLGWSLQPTKTYFLCFFVFVVCRFCTSKRSFGYVFLNLVRCVFIKVFVRD